MNMDVGVILTIELIIGLVVIFITIISQVGTLSKNDKKNTKSFEKIDKDLTRLEKQQCFLLDKVGIVENLVKEGFKDVKGRLTTLEDNTDGMSLKPGSPLKLTPLGEKLVLESGFKEIFEKTKESLATQLHKEYNPLTKYRVQEDARNLLSKISDEERQEFLPVQSYAYQEGQSFGKIMRTGSVLLRDYYLSIHPEIKE